VLYCAMNSPASTLSPELCIHTTPGGSGEHMVSVLRNPDLNRFIGLDSPFSD
jgi:hypothetical protein